MRAGAGKATIDLDGVLPYDGFDVVRDPICARVLVLEAKTRVCIVSLEVTSMREDLMHAVRATAATEARCDEAAVWASPSHTFSVPHVHTADHLFAAGDAARNDLLREAYVDAVRRATCEACDSLAPATLSRSQGFTSVNVNRDVETPAGWWLGTNPDGYSDHTVRTISVGREDGQTVATLFSVDVQSSVLDHSKTSDGARAVSGDLAGAAAAIVEESCGGVAIFLLGTAADQAPVEQAVCQEVTASGDITSTDAHEDGYAMLERLGARLAHEVMATLDMACVLDCDHITMTSHEVELPGQRRAEFSTLHPTRDYDFDPDVPVSTTVTALALGDHVLVGVGPELESRMGHLVRDATACQADVLTMVNGGFKYLPCAASYGRITYESMNSGYARGADAVLLDDLLTTIKALARNGANQ